MPDDVPISPDPWEGNNPPTSQSPWSSNYAPVHPDPFDDRNTGGDANAPTGPDAGQDHGFGWQSYSPGSTGSPDNNAATGPDAGQDHGFGWQSYSPGSTGSPDNNANTGPDAGQDHGPGWSNYSPDNTANPDGAPADTSPGDSSNNNAGDGSATQDGGTNDNTTGNDTGDQNNGAGSDGGGDAVAPILLDLSGKGLSVNSLSLSSQFLDLKGDGYQHRTAWAGAGNGVLVLDLYGDGQIHQQNQFAFTAWDPSAKGDLTALKDVFDTNHDGKLDAGDADWNLFKVMVNGQMVSLASLGITSIDLTPTGSGQTFNDGSAITGTTTYTKSDGTTGQVGDAVLASDSNGYLIHQTQVTNADSSVTTDILGYNADGSKAFENVVTVSANGLNKTAKYDDTGNGVFDRTQTDNTVTNADGSSTETITDFNADGSKKDATAVTRSADTKTVTTLVDQNGDGIWDQSEIFVTNVDSSTSTTTKNLAANGATINQIAVTTSANGLTKTTSIDHGGYGTFDHITTNSTVVNADGSRTETVTDTGNNGTLLDKTVTTTSADARSKTVQTDHTGSGSFDEVTTSSIVINSDNSVTTTVLDKNADGSSRDSTVSTISGDGLWKSVAHYLDGSSTPEDTAWDVVTVGTDGTRTETASDYSANNTLLSKTVTVTSGDKKTITTTIDANGDGATDQSKAILINADGSTTTTLSNFSSNGTLISRTLTTTSANGLSTTTKTDLNGDGTYDLTETDVITTNADGSKTETVTDASANGTLVDKSITTTTANGLTQTKQQDLNGDGAIDRTVTDAIVLNGDGSRTETLSTVSNTGALLSRTVTTDSADRKTTTVTIDGNGDGHVDRTEVSVLNADGSTTQTVTDTSASGAQTDQTVTTTNANGLSLSTSHNIDGKVDDTLQDATVLNANGSKTETIGDFSNNNTLLDKRIVTTSGNGLSLTTQTDANGDGVLDKDVNDVTVLNADGSKTETVAAYNGAGTALIGKTVTTAGGDGLWRSVTHYLDGSGTPEDAAWDVVTLGADGSRVETISDYSGNGTLISKKVTTTSADKKTVTINADLDGNGVNDVSVTATANADGSATAVTSTYNATGVLASKSTKTVSANGLSTTIVTDLNGDGAVDQSRTDVTVLNADGSRAETISNFNASGGLKNKTVITTSANGLSVTTQMDGTFHRTNSDVKTLNADGSTTEVVSDLNADGSLHDKTTTTTSANQMTVTTTRDINGDGTVDQTVIRQVNADGSTTIAAMDVATDGDYTTKRTSTVSANGLTKATVFESNSSDYVNQGTIYRLYHTILGRDPDQTGFHNQLSTLESGTSEVTLIGNFISSAEFVQKYGSPSNTQFVTLLYQNALGRAPDSAGLTNWVNALNGGESRAAVAQGFIDSAEAHSHYANAELDWVSANTSVTGCAPETVSDSTVLNSDGSTTETISWLNYAGTLTARSSTTTSGNGLTTTKQFDPTGAGTYSETRTDQTTLNADGSKTETLTETTGGTQTDRYLSTTSGNGLIVTKQWFFGAATTPSETETDMTVLNANGSKTETLTNSKSDGSLLSKTVRTTSANGLTVSIQQDTTGSGSFNQGQTDSTAALADGSVVRTVSDLNGDGSLRDKIITQTSADGRITTISRDATGDGVVDQTETDTHLVDGSLSRVITDLLASGAAADTMNSTTGFDGLTTNTSWDFNADGTVDRTRSDTRAYNPDGSYSETVKDYQTSTKTSTGWGAAITAVLLKTTTETVSADGRTKTTTVKLNSDTSADETSTAVTAIDGSIVTTTTNDAAAKAVAPLPGKVVWYSAMANNATVPSKMITTVSADGLSRTIQADYDGNGTYEHTETWQTQIDGWQIGTIQDVNASGVVVAKGTATISADGLTTTGTETGTNLNGNASATTHADGSITETEIAYNTNGTLNSTLALYVSADGQSTSSVVTTPPASSGALATSTTTVTGNGTTTTESNSNDTATINGTNNVLTVTSGQETATVSGTGNTINVNGNASASVTGGTGTVVDFNSSSAALSATSETINLATGSTVTIGGTGNTIVINANENVTLDPSGSFWGQGQADTFIFEPNFGHSTVSNFFAQGNVPSGGGSFDQIDVNHAVFADWAHLLAASTQSGSDVIITADANDTITLKNTTLASLQRDQSAFHFT
ncbi:DUF4214 domain-containing protein [Mesorhizobium sp. AR02]|uniref:DUF4214 domain-containing protein n=1 Tax=Mesorhizobium sp. AR02 TaxID=2865837 RepID=UPI00215E93C4|nr:DUF4214 domain-containing protein [Mesorhizobium sp. AR02]UVK54897.1 DUF4214 domain-containing protein [Mesorhizobium sp. AR02]